MRERRRVPLTGQAASVADPAGRRDEVVGPDSIDATADTAGLRRDLTGAHRGDERHRSLPARSAGRGRPTGER